LSRAAKWVIRFKVLGSVLASAYPAKLELTVVASHMVASFTLFNVSLAHGANSKFFSLGPLLELLVYLFFT
jgi:hypothetical protein